MPTIGATPGKSLVNCPLCDEPLGNNPNECSKCDWVKGYQERAGFSLNRRDAAAALLSLAVPGLGHVYKGHNTLAVLMLAGAAITAAFAVAFFTIIFPIPASPILLATYWSFAAIHAYAAHDFNPPAGEIVWKMVAMLIAGAVGAVLTFSLVAKFLHFSI